MYGIRGKSRETANSKATSASMTAIGIFICQSNSLGSTQKMLHGMIAITIIGKNTFQT